MKEATRSFPGEARRIRSKAASGEAIRITRLSGSPAEHSLNSGSDRYWLFVVDGGGEVVLDSKRSRLEAGNILCVPPATACQVVLEENASATLITIDELVFRTRVLNMLPGNMDRTSSFWRHYYTARILAHSTGVENRPIRLKTGAELEALTKYLGKGGDPAVVGTALVILMGSLKRQPVPALKETVCQSDTIAGNIVIEFRALIEEHFTRHLKVSQYAEMLGITQKTLLRACQAMTGRTAVSLIHDRIVLEATRHLRYSSRNVSDIAYSLGFDDVGYFSRFIKLHAGHSPSELRSGKP